jgi:hypothetical protein
LPNILANAVLATLATAKQLTAYRERLDGEIRELAGVDEMETVGDALDRIRGRLGPGYRTLREEALERQLTEAQALADSRYRALCELADREPTCEPLDETLIELLQRRKLDWRATGALIAELGTILGAATTGEPLTALATRAVLHADPVLRFLDAYSVSEINRHRHHLRGLLGGDAPPHGIGHGVADLLDAVAALACEVTS